MRQKFYVTTAVVLGLMLVVGVNSMAGAGRAVADPVSNVAVTGDHGGKGIASDTRVDKAMTLLQAARDSNDVDVSMLYVQRVLNMDLPADDARVNKVRFGAHWLMAELFGDVDLKRAHHLVLASRYIDNPAQNQNIAAMVEEMGIDPVTIGAGTTVARTAGTADTCDAAIDLTAHTAVGDLVTETLSIDLGGDEDWYTITVATGDPTGGLAFRIETFTDQPGVNPPAGDDSTLWLYDDCNAGTGSGIDLISINDDKGGPNPFMSRIDSPCLPEGTYYLRINAYLGNAAFKADNIDLEVEATGSCNFVIADGFEADGNRGDGTSIDLGDAGIQAHSIFPSADEDWVKFGLAENTWVSIKTECGFPTVFNGFATCDNPPEFDSAVALWYASPNVPVAGLCNNQIAAGVLDGAIGNGCNVDADCGPLTDPFPGLPDCVTWNFFGPGTTPVNPSDNPLAWNDDAAGGGLGSELSLCLPKTGDSPSSSVMADPATFNWYVSVDGDNATGAFDYELLVGDGGPCAFETEPNDGPADANDLPLDGGPVHGLFDYSASSPAGDQDWYKFDVPGPAVYEVSTDGFDPTVVDTFISLIVGPDENGDFFPTGDANDDRGGGDVTSLFEAALIPACELLGTCGGGFGTAYYVNMAPGFVQPNFPYSINAETLEGVFAEFIEYEDCDIDPTPAEAGNRFKASLGQVCDFDGFRFTLEEDSQVTLQTTGGGIDTTMQLLNCETLEPVGCDDDSGPGFASVIDGCLQGGKDYCVRIRAFSGFSLFNYELEINPGATCVADDPPTVTGDAANACSDPSGELFSTWAGCRGPFAACAEVPLLVVLESFNAQPTAEGVVIEWKTAQEIDVAGFRLLRDRNGREKALEVLTPTLIPGRGQGLEGASYQFIDNSKLTDGKVYYYLEDVDTLGRATRHGPVEVTIGGSRVRGATRVALTD